MPVRPQGKVVNQPELSAQGTERGLTLAGPERGPHAAVPETQPKSRVWWRDSLRRRLLALADALTAGLVALSLALDDGVASGLWAALVLPVWIVLAKLHGLYDRDHRVMRHLTVDELPAILVWATSGVAGTALLLLLTPTGAPSMRSLVFAWVVGAGSAFLLRSGARLLWRRLTTPERTLIIGNGPLADATRRKVDLFPDMRLELVGVRPQLSADEVRESPELLGEAERVVLATRTITEDLIAELLALCRRRHVKLSVVPPMRGMFGTAVQLTHVADLPVVEYNTADVSRSTLLLKRGLDVTVSSLALLLLSPLLAAIAIVIRRETRGPALFAQTRAGREGRPFRMYKFRTMVCDAEDQLADLVSFDRLPEPVFKLRDDPRVTGVGRFLRRTSLDELPQLLNVFKGEMSLVGPRPEQVELVERYTPEQRFRLTVKPGLTGPMQVYGRGELSFDERLALERDYIENFSLRRDIHLLALTIPVAVSKRGAF